MNRQFVPSRVEGSFNTAGQILGTNDITYNPSLATENVNSGAYLAPAEAVRKVFVVKSIDDLRNLQSVNSGSQKVQAVQQQGSRFVQSGMTSQAHFLQSGMTAPSHLAHDSFSAASLQGEEFRGHQADQTEHGQHGTEEEEVPEVDITVNNVVCSFSIRCHINLKTVAMEGCNVIYKRENNVVNMKLRKPYVTANIWSSGKVTCTGATSEEDSKLGARRVARILQQLGCTRARFCNFRVVNVLGTCSLPWGIKLNSFATAHPKDTSYEPELHPGATYRIKHPKATLKVFSTGSITITAPSVANLQNAVQHIFPLVYPFRLPKNKVDPQEVRRYQSHNMHSYGADKFEHFRYKKRVEDSEDDEESFGSDSS